MSRLFSRFSALILLSFMAFLSPVHDTWAKSEKDQPVSKADQEESLNTYKQLTLFADVLERTRADYVDDVKDEELIENAVNGMLMALDPHSSFLNKKDYEDMRTQTRGEFGGLGIEVTMEDNLIKVISPIDDTPAAKAGMEPNDLITHIDSKPVTEMTLSEAVDQMRGVPGTKIVLTVRRGGIAGQPFDVTIVRAIIKVISVRWETKDDVGYIRIKTFNEQTQPGLDDALNKLQKELGKNLKGYVVDLRNNPGGLLDQAVSVAGTFIPSGKEVVSTRSRHPEENQVYFSTGGDQTGGKPVVVLVNGGSASASEIVAGALQDYHRAIVLGTKSFGKGSVQTIIPIAGAGAMRLTTARYYTPSGRSIQKSGIEPDIEVQPAKLEEVDMGPGIREADLRGALDNDTLKNKKKNNHDQKDDDNGEVKKPYDNQLARALDLIRGSYLFSQQKTPAAIVKAKADTKS